MRAWLLRVGRILAWDDTRPCRLFLGLLDLVFALYLTTTVAKDDMSIMTRALNDGDSTMIWIFLFTLHGILVLRGLSGRYSFFTLMGEGVLGIFIWSITAITHTLAQGVPGPTSVCMAMTIWICARHPLDFRSGDRRHG